MTRSLVTAVAVLLLAGCQGGSAVPVEYRQMALLDVETPAAAKKGQPVTLKVTARRLDGCWAPSGTAATVDEATKTVTLVVTEQRTQAGPCTQALEWPVSETTFTPQASGTYTVKATVLTSKESNDKKDISKPIAVSE